MRVANETRYDTGDLSRIACAIFEQAERFGTPPEKGVILEVHRKRREVSGDRTEFVGWNYQVEGRRRTAILELASPRNIVPDILEQMSVDVDDFVPRDLVVEIAVAIRRAFFHALGQIAVPLDLPLPPLGDIRIRTRADPRERLAFLQVLAERKLEEALGHQESCTRKARSALNRLERANRKLERLLKDLEGPP